MKKFTIILFLIFTIFLFGCKQPEPVEKEEAVVVDEPLEEEIEEVEETEEVQEPEEVVEKPKEEPKEEEIEEVPEEEPVSGCGDGKCTYDESLCDETTYTTICTEDCQPSCPAKLILTDDHESNTNLPQSYFCGDDKCKKISGNNFEITGSSVVQTMVKNVGELASPMIVPRAECGNKGRARISVKFTGENINVNGAEANIVNWVPPRSQENNYVYLNIIIGLKELEEQTVVECDMELTSSGVLDNSQKVRLNMRPFLG